MVVPLSWKKRCPQNEHSVKLNKQNPSVGLTKTVVPFHTTFFPKKGEIGQMPPPPVVFQKLRLLN